MAKVNTYGITIKGLRKASGATSNYGYYSGEYVELFYDFSDGSVWGKYQYSLGHNTETRYHSGNVVKLCNATEHLTMQQIADLIRDAHERRVA